MARPSKKEYLLRVIRTSKGLSRETVAERSDTSFHNVWRAEVGGVLSEKVALKISESLGLSPDIMFYNMGRFPPDKQELVRKDPLFFKELMDEVCAEPWKLTKTKEYMEAIKLKMDDIKTKEKVNPEIEKMLSRIKPTQ